MKALYRSSVFTIIFFCLLCCSESLIDECPDPEDVYPCYCEEDDGPTVMHCNYLNESKQVQNALSKLTKYKIFKLSIYKNEIQTFRSNAFKGPEVSQIVFTNSTISMQAPHFVGQENSLKRLSFLSCYDEENRMNAWEFSHLENLRDITFDRNSIPLLKNNWITSTGPNLRSLTFSECSIQTLDDKVFKKVESLSTLFLNDNEISKIARSMFPKPAENLRLINLNDNKLQDLPDDIFEDMPSLNSLELQRNLLKTLSQSTWSPVIESFSRLSLDDNPIRCDRDLKWISKVSLPKNFSGKCKEPRKLQNKDLRILTPADFH